jgi:hypothetical protein
MCVALVRKLKHGGMHCAGLTPDPAIVFACVCLWVWTTQSMRHEEYIVVCVAYSVRPLLRSALRQITYAFAQGQKCVLGFGSLAHCIRFTGTQNACRALKLTASADCSDGWLGCAGCGEADGCALDTYYQHGSATPLRESASPRPSPSCVMWGVVRCQNRCVSACVVPSAIVMSRRGPLHLPSCSTMPPKSGTG